MSWLVLGLTGEELAGDGLIEIPSHPTLTDYVQTKLETPEATSPHQMLRSSFQRSKPDPRELAQKPPDVIIHVTRSIQGKQSKRMMSIWNNPKKERINRSDLQSDDIIRINSTNLGSHTRKDFERS